VAVLSPSSATLLKSFVWGTDLSGSFQGAGGVSGLLKVNDSALGSHFCAYDGNGNVTALVKATDGSIAAQYEYGPFGEVIRATGPMAKVNPFRWSTQYQDDETDLVMYPARPYNPSTGRFLCKDPIEELGGLNLYAFVANNPVNRFDPFGLKDYKKGTDDPTITPDPGAGAWDSEEWTWSNLALKQLIVNNIGIVWIGMPDAVNHVQHYFGNSGRDYTIRLQKMIDDVPSAKRVFNTELGLAQAFVESLQDGKHQITSGSTSGGYNGKSESKNWYYAVGGYSAWGKGNATVCKDEYTLEFQYKFYDRYNWDTGKSVTILGQTVTDAFMGEFHRQGLAREFDMRGAVKKTIKWKKGQAPKITDGWESEQGR
jgi:RHS repeat-associated protein